MLKQALEEFARGVYKKVYDLLPEATGKTKKNLYEEVGDSYALLGLKGGYFGALVRGRKPRSSSSSSNLEDAIFAWMTAVGGVPGIPKTKWGARRLTWLINTHGTRAHQRGGNPDLINLSFKEEVDKLVSSLGTTFKQQLIIELTKSLKK